MKLYHCQCCVGCFENQRRVEGDIQKGFRGCAGKSGVRHTEARDRQPLEMWSQGLPRNILQILRTREQQGTLLLLWDDLGRSRSSEAVFSKICSSWVKQSQPYSPE